MNVLVSALLLFSIAGCTIKRDHLTTGTNEGAELTSIRKAKFIPEKFVVINGAEIEDEREFHEEFSQAFGALRICPFYGRNFDALWDCLLQIPVYAEVLMQNNGQLIAKLKRNSPAAEIRYLELLKDLRKLPESPRFTFARVGEVSESDIQDFQALYRNFGQSFRQLNICESYTEVFESLSECLLALPADVVIVWRNFTKNQEQLGATNPKTILEIQQLIQRANGQPQTGRVLVAY